MRRSRKTCNKKDAAEGRCCWCCSKFVWVIRQAEAIPSFRWFYIYEIYNSIPKHTYTSYVYRQCQFSLYDWFKPGEVECQANYGVWVFCVVFLIYYLGKCISHAASKKNYYKWIWRCFTYIQIATCEVVFG